MLSWCVLLVWNVVFASLCLSFSCDSNWSWDDVFRLLNLVLSRLSLRWSGFPISATLWAIPWCTFIVCDGWREGEKMPLFFLLQRYLTETKTYYLTSTPSTKVQLLRLATLVQLFPRTGRGQCFFATNAEKGQPGSARVGRSNQAEDSAKRFEAPMGFDGSYGIWVRLPWLWRHKSSLKNNRGSLSSWERQDWSWSQRWWCDACAVSNVFHSPEVQKRFEQQQLEVIRLEKAAVDLVSESLQNWWSLHVERSEVWRCNWNSWK